MNETQESCTGEPLLVPGALRGYRSWETHGRRPGNLSPIDLYALTGPAWDVTLQAYCRKLDSICNCGPCNENATTKREHDAPKFGCTCGIYGYHSPEFLTHNEYPIIVGFLGVIEASGRVLVGTKGFRAEKARILAIAPWMSPIDGNLLMERELTNVAARVRDISDIKVFPTFDEVVENYPPEDYESFIKTMREN